jgi:glucarate dehydratase
MISDVRVTPILISDPPLLNCQGVHQPTTPRTIVEVVTDDGVVGIGETYGDTDYLSIAQALAPTLRGRPLTSLNGLFAEALPVAERVAADRVDLSVTASGLRGARSLRKFTHSVVSAFEVACLDALGHLVEMPVHALLGGKVRDRVEYSGYLFYKYAGHPGEPADKWGAALDPEGIVAQARRMAESYGFSSFKLKGGVFPPEQEIAAVRALYEALPGHPLRIDPNGAWSVSTSLRVASELDGMLEYLEDPTWGIDGMAEVARHTSLPLATNMCVTSVDEVPEAFAKGAVQVVLSDHHYWGGLLATRDLAATCRTYGVGLSMHSNTHLGISLAAMTHVAATIGDLRYACDTHRPWQVEDVIIRPHEFTGGFLDVSDEPGLGVELDRAALERLHRRWLDSDVRDRDDDAAMRRCDPRWETPTLPRW